MSIVGDLFGQGSNQGASFVAQAPDLINPGLGTTNANSTYNQANSGLAQEQAFLNALAGQNGIANQSSVYDQLQGVANGTGANPAMAQLNQATGQNVQNQAALMAGQRGASSNVGLLARQAAMQGSNAQQQAIGQGANLQAQQSLNALSGLGSMANTQVSNQAGALTGYNQAAQSEQSNVLNAIGNYNNAKVSAQNGMNSANAGIASTNAQGLQGLTGGLLGGAGAAATFLNRGGMVKGYADGGQVDASGPQSFAGQFLKNWSGGNSNIMAGISPFSGEGMSTGAQELNRGADQFGAGLGKGLASLFKSTPDTGTIEMPNLFPQSNPGAGMTQNISMGMNTMSAGGKVAGSPAVKGDSPKNDTVPAMLSPGEVVIPRSIMSSKDAPERAKAFVEAVLKQHGLANGGMVKKK